MWKDIQEPKNCVIGENVETFSLDTFTFYLLIICNILHIFKALFKEIFKEMS